ncbi:DUF721 domain-containing protein [Aureimonas populi]|uniref:DUF721 domain-containing protein n=1 Tax=Aureimonas populi TaxID=1701758 RepID=A0ABW5CPE7_9HYPH|nr:DciA family protein [Aureimonas populi]
MTSERSFRKPPRRPAVRPLADLVAALVDPMLARKAGLTSGLVAAWPEIAGPRLAAGTRPEKLIWAARRSDTDPFEPATLVVACEGASALRLQHEAGELLQRIDAFFGYHAVGRLKIVQKALPAPAPSRKPRLADIGEQGRQTIAEATARIEDPRLRAALERFGHTVLGRNRAGD